MNNNINDYDFQFKIIMMGNTDVGKTQLMKRYVDNIFSEEFSSTIGMDFKIKKIQQDGQIFKLQIWDTALSEKYLLQIKSQQLYQIYIKSYYRDIKGVLLCYSINYLESFDRLSNYYQDIERLFEMNNSKPIVLLCGLKCDLEGKRQVSRNSAQAFADAHNLTYIENSAKLNINVDFTFELLNAQIKKKIEKESQFIKEKKLYLNQQQFDKDNLYCC